MKVSIVSDSRNPFMKRKEVVAVLEHESEPTPAKAALQQYLAKELSTDAEKIEVKSIFTETGIPRSHAKAFAWEEKSRKSAAGGKEEKKTES